MLVNVYHFDRISSLDGKEYIKIDKNNQTESIPTSIYEAFRYAIEKEIAVCN
jgi:hypothetical protein